MSGRNFSKHPVEKRLLVLSLMVLLCAVALMGQVASKVKSEEQDEEFYQFVDLFSEVYKDIQDKYYKEVDSQKLFEGVLNGMFLELDPHSQYMGPDELMELEKDTEGQFSGVGIQITLKNKVLTVVAPIPGSPAAKMGLQPWDRIIEIEGKSTEGITLIEAVKKLTGPPGTTVTITVYREGEAKPLHFTLTRETIKIRSIYSEIFDNDIGYIRIAKFSERTAKDLEEAIMRQLDKGVKGLIIDVRFNTGGLLQQAIEVADLFVAKGEVIVSTRGRLKSQNREYMAERKPIVHLPMVVLINQFSASASEIFAGAIKDHHLGILVGPKGEKTFGKGSVQTIEELHHSLSKDEQGNYRRSAIRLTTAEYFTPNGNEIQDVGIKPDWEVELPEGHELMLSRHGLLGEPDVREPENRETKQPEETPQEGVEYKPQGEVENPDTVTTPSLEEPAPEETPSEFYLPKSTEKEETKEEKFVDIQLEEAIKIIKAYITMETLTAESR
jgi:carboxyl-terminal processing protease